MIESGPKLGGHPAQPGSWIFATNGILAGLSQKMACQNARITRKMRPVIAGTTFFCNSDTTLYHYIMTGRFAVPVC